MTKRKNRKSLTLSEIVFQQFEETGDVTGLGALADYHQERDEKSELVNRLRLLLDGEWNASVVRFFYSHAGYSVGAETEQEGRFRGACKLAQAEQWLERLRLDDDAYIEWEHDDWAWTDAEDGRPYWQCVVVVKHDGKERHQSLAGIDLGWNGPMDDPYSRVVVAELAYELMGAFEEN